MKSTDCGESFAVAYTGLLPFFVPKCPMSVPWYVGLLVSTVEGTLYQTEVVLKFFRFFTSQIGCDSSININLHDDSQNPVFYHVLRMRVLKEK